MSVATVSQSPQLVVVGDPLYLFIWLMLAIKCEICHMILGIVALEGAPPSQYTNLTSTNKDQELPSLCWSRLDSFLVFAPTRYITIKDLPL